MAAQTREPLQFEVTHVTSKDDFVSIVDVEHSAFGSSETMALMFPSSPSSTPESSLALSVSNHQKCFLTDPTAHYLKASLPDGKIIGMAKWNFFLDASTWPQHPWSGMESPPNTNKELWEYLFGGLDNARNDYMKEQKRHFLMAILVVSPEYQRMGVGVKLLEWGLQEADRERMECWIDASPFGVGLYRKFGWVEVGGLDVELGRWGGEKGKVRRTVHMVRKPKGKESMEK